MTKQKQRPTYPTIYKAGCIATLESAGYPGDVYALERVAKEANVPGRTLRRWWLEFKGAPAADNRANNQAAMSELVSEKKLEIKELLGPIMLGLAAEVQKRIDENKLGEIGLPQLMTALAIGIDKHQLLAGKPTQRVASVQEELESIPEEDRDDVISRAAEYVEGYSRGRAAAGDSGLSNW